MCPADDLPEENLLEGIADVVEFFDFPGEKATTREPFWGMERRSPTPPAS
jgi:hypothetical protein